MICNMENKITIVSKEASISVSVFLFREGDAFIAYCPSLDLSGYDVTEDNAKRDFEFVLKAWLKEQLENGTLKRDLERHGWKVEDGKADEPSVTDWIRRNSSAGRIFTMPEFRKTNIRTGVFC